MATPVACLAKLNNPPDAAYHDAHVWVDYVELLCLANVDRSLSKSDLLDHLNDQKDLGTVGQSAGDANGGGPQGQSDDDRAAKVDDWYRHFSYRLGAFQDFYPFQMSSNGNTLRVNKPLTAKRKLYIFLLLLSSQKYIAKKSDATALTKCFEILSRDVMESYIPGAEVHIFGTSSSGKGRFKGNLWKKIGLLASCLQEKVKVSEDEFSPMDAGDNGLDIVAWIPLDDSCNGLLAIFGQCACTPEWVAKQHSSGWEAWREVMDFKSPPSNVAFIPYCFRAPNGGWHQSRDIHGSILIDRLRFLNLLRDKTSRFRALPCYSFVEQALQYREPVF
jgi:hypothetical protein